MKNSFETALLESGSVIKRGYSALLQNFGKAVAILTALIAVLVTFTEVGFYEFGKESFTANLITMLICSYVMYFSLEDAGERLGKESEEYKSVEAAWREKCRQVGGEDIGRLRDFLKEYKISELKFRREGFLIAQGYSTEEYTKYLATGDADKKARRVFKRAEKMKPVDLTPKTLLANDRRGGNGELTNPEKGKIPKLLIRLVPSTFCMIFTVSVMLSAKDGLTAPAVIEGIVKLLTLPIIGLRGYSSGYAYAKGSLLSWVETKSRLLGAFLAEGNQKA